MMYNTKGLKQKVKTSTSVFGDGRISTHANPTRGQCARQIGQCTGQHGPRDQRASSDFGLLGELLGEQSSPKCEISCPGRRWTTMQNLTPLALSLVEKFVTVQTHTHTKKHYPIYPHLAYQHVWLTRMLDDYGPAYKQCQKRTDIEMV